VQTAYACSEFGYCLATRSCYDKKKAFAGSRFCLDQVRRNKCPRSLDYETYVNRANFEAMQGFHAGNRKSSIGGTDGKHGLIEYTTVNICYTQN
jgi:hypothetical protein